MPMHKHTRTVTLAALMWWFMLYKRPWFAATKTVQEIDHVLIIGVWKIIFLSKWVICRFHVNLPGCVRYVFTIYVNVLCLQGAIVRLPISHWVALVQISRETVVPFVFHRRIPTELCNTGELYHQFTIGWYWIMSYFFGPITNMTRTWGRTKITH